MITKKEIQALVKEAKSHGINVIGSRDAEAPNRAILSLSAFPSDKVASAFARKYKSRVIPSKNGKEAYIPIEGCDTAMSTEVAEYHNANILLAKCEHKLNVAVWPIVAKAAIDRNKEMLTHLTETLPATYPGLRRIYEMLEKM